MQVTRVYSHTGIKMITSDDLVILMRYALYSVCITTSYLHFKLVTQKCCGTVKENGINSLNNINANIMFVCSHLTTLHQRPLWDDLKSVFFLKHSRYFRDDYWNYFSLSFTFFRLKGTVKICPMYIPHKWGIYIAVSKLPQKENDT